MKMILVPEWLLLQLNSHGKSLGALLDSQLLSTLSTRDLAFYSFLCERFYDLLPDSVRSDWLISTVPEAEHNMSQLDIGIYYQTKREFSSTYSYDFNAAKLVELCSGECLGMTSNDSEVKRDCLLGFDVIGNTEDNFFVKAKEVDQAGLLQCFDQLFTVVDKKYSIERIAKLQSFRHYQLQLASMVKSGTITES